MSCEGLQTMAVIPQTESAADVCKRKSRGLNDSSNRVKPLLYLALSCGAKSNYSSITSKKPKSMRNSTLIELDDASTSICDKGFMDQEIHHPVPNLKLNSRLRST